MSELKKRNNKQNGEDSATKAKNNKSSSTPSKNDQVDGGSGSAKKDAAPAKDGSSSKKGSQAAAADARREKPTPRRRRDDDDDDDDEEDDDDGAPGGYSDDERDDDSDSRSAYNRMRPEMEEGPVLKHDHRVEEEESRPLAPLPAPDDADDTLILISAFVGFFLCMACGGALPVYANINSELVMGGGMGTLMLFLVYLMTCPTACGGGRKKGANGVPYTSESGVTPVSVFLVAGCIGSMLGGMFGGTYKNIQWEK